MSAVGHIDKTVTWLPAFATHAVAVSVQAEAVGSDHLDWAGDVLRTVTFPVGTVVIDGVWI